MRLGKDPVNLQNMLGKGLSYGVFAVLVLFFSECPSDKVIFESLQPKNLSYNSYDPYRLQVIEGTRNWNSLSFDRAPIIRVVKAGDTAYGHFITLEITGGSIPSTATWKADGIDLQYPSGHRLFIPRRAFIGGR